MIGEGVWLAAASGRLSQNTRFEMLQFDRRRFWLPPSRHAAIEFSSEQVDAILNYLGDLIV